jgi:hypothetical protein
MFWFTLTVFLRSIPVSGNITMRAFLENLVAACLLLIVLLKLARMEPPYGYQDLADDASPSDPLWSRIFGSQTPK